MEREQIGEMTREIGEGEKMKGKKGRRRGAENGGDR